MFWGILGINVSTDCRQWGQHPSNGLCAVLNLVFVPHQHSVICALLVSFNLKQSRLKRVGPCGSMSVELQEYAVIDYVRPNYLDHVYFEF